MHMPYVCNLSNTSPKRRFTPAKCDFARRYAVLTTTYEQRQHCDI